MSISVDGNTLTWDGTVTITNATDITTGVATLMLTPTGGVGNLPALAQGDPGLPPVIDSVNITQVPWGTTPAAPQWTLVSQGGPGVASHYTLSFQVNSGQQGPSGTMTVGSATDVTGTQTDQYILKYQTSDSKYHNVAQLCGDVYNVTSFTSAAGNASPQTLASITIPAQPFDWRPEVNGFAVPTGTVWTHLDLICRLNNAATGDQVGYGKGVTGAGTAWPAMPVVLIPSFGASIGSGSYGRVAKGQSAVLYFNVIQTAFTIDSFSVPASSCSFTVKVNPIPGTNT